MSAAGGRDTTAVLPAATMARLNADLAVVALEAI